MSIDDIRQGAVLKHIRTGRLWKVCFSPGRNRRRVFVWLQELGTQKTRHSLISTVLEKFALHTPAPTQFAPA